VFGRRAGRSAAARAVRMTSQPFRLQAAAAALDLVAADGTVSGRNSADMIQRLQSIMADDVGPFRTRERLERALAKIDELAEQLGARPFGDGRRFDMRRIDWFDLRNMLLVARVVAKAARQREESRGAHQREDFPGMRPEWRINQVARWRENEIEIVPMPRAQGLPPQAGEGREGGMARLRVWRGLAPQAGHFEIYEVPFERGQSVLDGLRWIRMHRDPTLAMRFSCINANACKECMMEIDGATVYACTTRLEPREMTVQPLSNKAPVRDLVTEIAPPAERLGRDNGLVMLRESGASSNQSAIDATNAVPHSKPEGR
jgi:hypothetical protein